jgi:hypothetical protein
LKVKGALCKREEIRAIFLMYHPSTRLRGMSKIRKRPEIVVMEQVYK